MTDGARTEELLARACQGDRQAREDLIAASRTFIAAVVAAACRRPVVWGYDDELSIGLIAFNEAIDAYDRKMRSRFSPFAGTVIRRRLIDYFRRNARAPLPLPETDLTEGLPGPHEVREAWEAFRRDELARERADEIARFEQVLAPYGLDLEKLAWASPTHRRTRTVLQRVAAVLAGRSDLLNQVRKTGKLPQQDLCRLCGVTPRVLERGRPYVIALALLLADPEFPCLRSYLDIRKEGGA